LKNVFETINIEKCYLWGPHLKTCLVIEKCFDLVLTSLGWLHLLYTFCVQEVSALPFFNKLLFLKKKKKKKTKRTLGLPEGGWPPQAPLWWSQCRSSNQVELPD
jgi:hypothetical protein